MDQFLGKMLDNRYEILDVLGTGGMAVVYKARCHRLNRLVAVKILKSELAQDAELRRRFHDESQAVAMLSHPNIVAVYDVSKTDDVEYIVMELIDGITLKQYMQQRGGSLPWREALHFINQIVKALGHAHGRGIIHRDIKPHNIMVLRDGSVKVADFGIARFTASQNTLTQEALGSVHYISPEQARGSHIDARSDLYSAGVVLYEMLTGRLPYEGDSPVAVAIQHINSIPLSPRELNPDIPDALELITMKAMASDPAKRYHSADAMLSDLEEFRKNPNINFDYTMENLFAGKGVDEPTQVLSGVRTMPERRPERSRREEEDEDDGEPRGGKAIYIAAIAAVLILVCGVGYFLYANFLKDWNGPGPTYLVPNVVGVDWNALQSDAQYQEYWEDFQFVLGEQVPDDSEPGRILEQDPRQGDTVTRQGTVVTVTVSTGPGSGQMLDVTGKPLLEARVQLEPLIEELNLKVTTRSEASETVEKDHVIRTDPVAGFDLQKNDTVILYISTGAEPKQVNVPDFTTMSREDVDAWLLTVNLKVKYVENVPSDRPAGSIIYQSVAKDTMVDEGTTIILHLSAGPAETPEITLPPETDPPASVPPEATDAPPSSEPVVKYVTLPVLLPPGQEGDSPSVNVRVTLDGEEVENADYLRSLGTIQVEIGGIGRQEAVIYVDGKEYSRTPVNFETEGVSRE
ncbi:MAG: Stk1 family PASTA domain-containing Ser/Thr kinase [Oscillospiraceae bacterium]|nr:Stk1 family PASTA domain-containing Ser/Thr kinase [Oscillospiraceae bacterium]